MAQQQQNFVTIRNMSYSYGERLIFENINLDIPYGKITAIMGPSGTGKTTLLRLIGGQLKPDKGLISVDGQNISQLSRKKLYLLRRRMGLLFQSGALFTNLSVYDNVAFQLRFHTDLSEPMIRHLVMMKLESVGLRGAAHLMPSELSGGMARRVALARTLILDPELILYDEPFTGQDPVSMAVAVQLIKRFNDAMKLTSIIVSHDVPETSSIADYIYLFHQGKIVGKGSPKEMQANNSPHVRQFFHGLADGAVPFHYPATDYSKDLLQGEQLP